MAGSRNKPSVDLAGSVAAVLSRYLIQADQTLTVALSGGVDSAVLLDLVHRLQADFGYRFDALHIDHQISPRAAQWAAFCAHMCERRQIPLRIQTVVVDRESGRGIEAAARAARYRVFEGTASDWLLTAHNQDDQIETVFLNLLRGTGPHGLGGIPESRGMGGDGTSQRQILRPLLDVDRARIVAYARWRGLEWIEDESNLDLQLARNFLRHDCLPRLAHHFAGFREPVLRSARWAAEASDLLDVLAAGDHDRCTDEQGRLSVTALQALGEARGKNLLRYWLRRHGVRPPDARKLAEMLRQVVSAAAGARIDFVVGTRVVRRYRSWLVATPLDVAAAPPAVCWNGATHVAWGRRAIDFEKVCGGGISMAALRRSPAIIRTRRGGERIRLQLGRPSRSLKNLLQEAGVPPWERPGMPLLWCGDDLVWVPAVGIAAEFRCAPGEDGWLPTWVIPFPDHP